MTIIRFEYQQEVHYGLLKEETIELIKGDIFGEYELTEQKIPANEVKLLSPVHPSKIVCVGLNYKDHAAEVNLEVPKAPLLFLKPNTSIIGPNDDIVYPPQSNQVDYEAELAIIIGKKAKDISEEESKDYIFGYTCANDVTARDIQFGDGQWTRGKSFDTFCPIGPVIVKDIDHDDAEIELYVNGEIKQKSNINQFIFRVPEMVSYISKVMTLLPGDVILTGTPHGIGPVQPGDKMTVKIKGIGELSNTIVAKESASKTEAQLAKSN